MSIAQSLLPEYDQEMAGTRKTLERCPDDKWNWKPHEKSGTLGWLAAHVATLPEWTTMTLRTEQFDYAPVGGSTYQPPKISNRKELLAAFDKSCAEARAAIASASDQEMTKDWSLLAGGKNVFTMPRVAVLRTIIMNHLIHHRAQLGVYFRLIGVPFVPSGTSSVRLVDRCAVTHKNVGADFTPLGAELRSIPTPSHPCRGAL